MKLYDTNKTQHKNDLCWVLFVSEPNFLSRKKVIRKGLSGVGITDSTPAFIKSALMRRRSQASSEITRTMVMPGAPVHAVETVLAQEYFDLMVVGATGAGRTV